MVKLRILFIVLPFHLVRFLSSFVLVVDPGFSKRERERGGDRKDRMNAEVTISRGKFKGFPIGKYLSV